MKVWIVNHYAIPPTEAGGTRHYGLAAELISRGHQVTIIASSFDHNTRRELRLNRSETGRLVDETGVPFLWLKTPAYKGNRRRVWNMLVFAARVLFGRDIRNLGHPDVVFGSTLTLFAAFAALRLARRLRVPFVLEVRDVWPQTLIDFGVSRFHPIVLLFGVIERYLYRNSVAVISLLPGAVKHIRTNGAVDQRIEWLPNGLDFSLIPEPTFPKIDDSFCITYAGSLCRANSLKTVIDAATLLQKRNREDVRFRLVGTGPLKARLVQIARDRGLRNIQFAGPVTKHEVYAELSGAHALVLALQNVPLYRFGTSLNKLYDYMAVARPILFAGNSYNNAVAHSCCGLVVPPEDPEAMANAVEQLAAMTTEQRWQMGLRGRKYVEQNHDFARLAERLDGFLADVVNRTDRTATSADRNSNEKCDAVTAEVHD